MEPSASAEEDVGGNTHTPSPHAMQAQATVASDGRDIGSGGVAATEPLCAFHGADVFSLPGTQVPSDNTLPPMLFVHVQDLSSTRTHRHRSSTFGRLLNLQQFGRKHQSPSKKHRGLSNSHKKAHMECV